MSAETKLSQADKISKEARMQLSSSREERVREQSAVELATQNTVSIERAIEENRTNLTRVVQCHAFTHTSQE